MKWKRRTPESQHGPLRRIRGPGGQLRLVHRVKGSRSPSAATNSLRQPNHNPSTDPGTDFPRRFPEHLSSSRLQLGQVPGTFIGHFPCWESSTRAAEYETDIKSNSGINSSFLFLCHNFLRHVRVDHEVKMGDFERWLEKPGGSPREVVERQRIRAILGMEVSR
jgi:hypothetical protein